MPKNRNSKGNNKKSPNINRSSPPKNTNFISNEKGGNKVDSIHANSQQKADILSDNTEGTGVVNEEEKNQHNVNALSENENTGVDNKKDSGDATDDSNAEVTVLENTEDAVVKKSGEKESPVNVNALSENENTDVDNKKDSKDAHVDANTGDKKVSWGEKTEFAPDNNSTEEETLSEEKSHTSKRPPKTLLYNIVLAIIVIALVALLLYGIGLGPSITEGLYSFALAIVQLSINIVDSLSYFIGSTIQYISSILQTPVFKSIGAFIYNNTYAIAAVATIVTAISGWFMLSKSSNLASSDDAKTNSTFVAADDLLSPDGTVKAEKLDKSSAVNENLTVDNSLKVQL